MGPRCRYIGVLWLGWADSSRIRPLLLKQPVSAVPMSTAAPPERAKNEQSAKDQAHAQDELRLHVGSCKRQFRWNTGDESCTRAGCPSDTGGGGGGTCRCRGRLAGASQSCPRRSRCGGIPVVQGFVRDDRECHGNCSTATRTDCSHSDGGSNDPDLETVDVTGTWARVQRDTGVVPIVGGRYVVQNRRTAIGDGRSPRDGCSKDAGNGGRVNSGGRPRRRHRGRCFC
jgi:hypothetical protein